MSPCPCLHVPLSPCVHVSMSPCPCLHASMSMSPCLHVSMSQCLHVSMSTSPGFYVSMSPFSRPCLLVLVHVSMSSSMSACPRPCLYVLVHVAMSCFHVLVQVSMAMPMSLSLKPYGKRKTELTTNGNFILFAAIGKRKRQTSVCLLQMETENGSLFSMVSKR
jgi:hypothetical protein